jgi:hypothetical protein
VTLSLEENSALEQPFSEEEVRLAIFGSYANGAPGPDGLSFLFYQTFWDVIKLDFMALAADFWSGSFDVFRLNFSTVTFISKEPDAREIKKFRPISLGNCSLKIFTKIITNRISPVADRLISANQSAFIKGRFILESVVSAHEVFHKVHRS